VALIPHHLPEYVELGGRQVWRPPYTARNAEVFGFVIKADRNALDGLLTKALVEPAGGAVDYRCAHDHIVVTFTRIERLASGDPPDSDGGYLPEKEVAVWCLAADALAGNRLVWYIPYVFTDSGQTVATGREVYGYPKQIGYFEEEYPNNLLHGGDTTVEGLGIDFFGQDTESIRRPMISAVRHPGQPGEPEDAVVGGTDYDGFEFDAEFTTVFGELQVSAGLAFGPTPEPSLVITPADAPPPPRDPPAPPWSRRLLHAIHGRGGTVELIVDMVKNPTLVFLKQFRDVSCPTKASYQAVVEAPLAIRVGSAIPPYQILRPERFSIGFADWASHPIASDLGVAAWAGLTPERAFRAQFDFDIMLGTEVWRAST
jgi:hypothetical protein